MISAPTSVCANRRVQGSSSLRPGAHLPRSSEEDHCLEERRYPENITEKEIGQSAAWCGGGDQRFGNVASRQGSDLKR
eukprot:2419764-Rhodomonas_salina.1